LTTWRSIIYCNFIRIVLTILAIFFWRRVSFFDFVTMSGAPTRLTPYTPEGEKSWRATSSTDRTRHLVVAFIRTRNRRHDVRRNGLRSPHHNISELITSSRPVAYDERQSRFACTGDSRSATNLVMTVRR